MSIFNYQEKPGYFSRLKEALESTKRDLGDQIGRVIGSNRSRLSMEQLEELEEILITCDLGVETTLQVIDRLRDATRDGRPITSFQARRLVRHELHIALENPDPVKTTPGQPHVVLVVGVNGVGKTTTIGKLAHLYREEGQQVLICAADTFRAAAVEQLQIWADRTGSEIIKQGPGADPAAVLFDSLAAAKARRKDVVIVDTAGRLHNKANLMQELEKMRRVAGRETPGAPHEVLLILDATTGQNGLVQARQFREVAGVTGVIVTKLDGTAKGGIVVAIARDLNLPILYVGTGEGIEDLLPFSAEAFVDSLLQEDPEQSGS